MPYKLDENGLQIPTRPELLGEMLADYQSPDPAVGYGPDADVSTDSPIYRIAQRVASQVALAWQAVRDWTGQLDPDNAVGQQLDRLGSLINLKRRGRTRSTIPGRLIGVPGTVVAAGGRVRYKPLGTLWDVPAGTIGASGTLAVDATSADFGPVDANAGGAADWEIVSGQVDGWTGFDSQSPATLGALAADDPEFRPEFKRAARGLATYDAIVREVRDVANVTNVYLYVNPSLDPDPLTGLKGKQMWLVVQGGARLDIAAAIHRSVGTPVDTVGKVSSTINPGNGQALVYKFDRLTRRRGYLRLTYTGGNPKAPLPDDAEARVFAAVAAIEPAGGQDFNPMVYGTAGLLAILAVAPSSVTKLVAEARLDPNDPWVEDAVTVPLDQSVEVATGPVGAVAYSVAEDPIAIAGLADIWVSVNGQAAVQVVFPALPTQGSAAVAAVIQAGVDPLQLKVDSDGGRVRFRTTLTGATASIGFPAGSAAIALGLELLLFSGSDGDVEVVLVP